MNQSSRTLRATRYAAAAAVALLLAACGGGGSAPVTSTTAATPAPAQDTMASASSGAITAFGSVFVNGHEFNTDRANVVDDDTGAATAGTKGLEVGMVVNVSAASGSTQAAPVASVLHVDPLARGYVDAIDTTAGTLKVMGQTVQLTSSTLFSDHRSCTQAATSPCAAVTTASGLAATSGATAGSYVTVHGYLFGTSSSGANIVATLVSVADTPAGSGPANFKAEGTATVAGSTVTIGALKLDLSKATCFGTTGKADCASAFTTGQVVSAGSATAPTSPATTLTATFARVVSRVPVETAGAKVELEGAVSSVSATSFVVRGISVDASSLPSGTAMPAVGDIVRVTGTIGSTGQSVSASAVTVLHAANAVAVGLEGDASNVAAGSAAGTFTLNVLGQTVTVNSTTHLADLSVAGWDDRDPAANPFNISTFKTYLAASTSKHVIVRAETDSSGALVARSLVIVPASTVAAVAGIVDAKPAPSNSTAAGTPTTFSIHGVAVSTDPAAIQRRSGSAATPTIAAGDQVVATGTYASGTLTVAATPSRTNSVVDFGVPSTKDRGEF